MVPFGVNSTILLAEDDTNAWSKEEIRTVPLKSMMALLKAWIDSRSKWLVGSSSTKRLGFWSIILEIIHLTFSPPESTVDFLSDSSPVNNILPKNVRTWASSWLSEYCLSQSIRMRSESKYFELSLGR